jgi:hypothetical protein
MNNLMRLATIAAILTLAACAASPVVVSDSSNKLVADENGGKIPDALGQAQSQSLALVTSHCAKHDKKGFITKMDYENNSITFECHKQTLRR